MVKLRAYGCINLLGSPSDIYHGRVISSVIDGFTVDSLIREGHECAYSLNNYKSDELEVIGGAINSYLSTNNILSDAFELSCLSKIPKPAELGGTAAFIASILAGINKLFYLGFNDRDIAYHTSRIEQSMGVTSGFQNGFSIVHGGVKFMDFSSSDYKSFVIEDLNLPSLPLWIAVRSRNTNVYDLHKSNFVNYAKSKELQEVVSRISNLSLKGKEALLKNDAKMFGSLMNENHELNNKYLSIGSSSEDVIVQRLMDEELINRCLKEPGVLGVKMGGSNGSVLVLGSRPDFLKDYRLSPDLSKRALKYGFKLGDSLIKDVVPFKVGSKLTVE